MGRATLVVLPLEKHTWDRISSPTPFVGLKRISLYLCECFLRAYLISKVLCNTYISRLSSCFSYILRYRMSGHDNLRVIYWLVSAPQCWHANMPELQMLQSTCPWIYKLLLATRRRLTCSKSQKECSYRLQSFSLMFTILNEGQFPKITWVFQRPKDPLACMALSDSI